jgi:lipopolysaccharide transport system ATP-binding protein
MTRREIRLKFDEIVDFAEVEKFLDTPVKRYSSGMYVRLAFAVAAHLEPEILVVDEVLAVGDASFQKKCLGKMGDVSKDGRTILFVSHNMAAVAALCSRCLLIANGQLSNDANPTDAISYYMQGSAKVANSISLENHPNRSNGMKCWLTKLELSTIGENALCGQPFHLIFSYDFPEQVVTPQFCATITTMLGSTVFTLISDYQENNISSHLNGKGKVSCRILKLPLMPGDYLISIKLWVPGQKLDDIENVTQIKVDWHERSSQQLKWNSGHGPVYVDACWRLESSC